MPHGPSSRSGSSGIGIWDSHHSLDSLGIGGSLLQCCRLPEESQQSFGFFFEALFLHLHSDCMALQQCSTLLCRDPYQVTNLLRSTIYAEPISLPAAMLHIGCTSFDLPRPPSGAHVAAPGLTSTHLSTAVKFQVFPSPSATVAFASRQCLEMPKRGCGRK